jgi:triosephosphate isomerase
VSVAKKYLIAANWKMNLGPHEASLLVGRLDQHIEADRNVRIALCPPFIDLWPLSRELNKKKFRLGSQNLHYLDAGPYTGEISPAMLKDMVDYAIVGHSERRRDNHEDDKLIAKKVAAAVRHDITPILCVGDTLIDRESGHATKVVNDQLTANLALVTSEELGRVVVTYEPVWAISKGDGHGTFAAPAEVAKMIQGIRGTVEDLYGEGFGTSLIVLYGGSVNGDDAKAYLDLPGVDGLLVGGASLNYAEFSKIVGLAQKAAA